MGEKLPPELTWSLDDGTEDPGDGPPVQARCPVIISGLPDGPIRVVCQDPDPRHERLLLAAPELLAALRDVSHWLPRRAFHSKAQEVITHKVRAAIAAATGGDDG